VLTSRWKLVLVMTAAVAALAVGEALIARGMRQSGRAEGAAGWWAGARVAVTNAWVVSGALLLVLHLGLYATALSEADLSLVMPITAASYPLGAVLARFFLREEVNPARWLGTAVIAVGVAVVAWGEARSSP
jgi:drug/metabolite transporter (DMT)-like permease